MVIPRMSAAWGMFSNTTQKVFQGCPVQKPEGFKMLSYGHDMGRNIDARAATHSVRKPEARKHPAPALTVSERPPRARGRDVAGGGHVSRSKCPHTQVDKPRTLTSI